MEYHRHWLILAVQTNLDIVPQSHILYNHQLHKVSVNQNISKEKLLIAYTEKDAVTK